MSSVLSVGNVSKKFSNDLRRSLAYAVADAARDLGWRDRRPVELRPGEFWALDDVSFEVSPGEAVALVGDNGAGKSTLLKLIYGLFKPDRGEIRVGGQVEALLELTTGFNPALSGRENVEIGAAIRRLDRRRTSRLLDRVVDFAELAEFIDAPVQGYSSGMKARLGYALCAHLDPDLLLVDEILAVGDIAFQHKCMNHLRRYLGGGGTLVLVSHNLHQIQSICSRGILLEHGRVRHAGSAVEAVNVMLEEQSRRALPAHAPASSATGVAIEQVVALPRGGGEPRAGEPLEIVVRYHAREPIEVAWGVSIWTSDQWTCVGSAWNERGVRLAEGQGELRCLIPRVPMVGGRFLVRAALFERGTMDTLAVHGVHSPGLAIDLRPAAGRFTNLQMERNHLVNLDAVWP